jgi:hypothetical protein
MLFVTIDLLFPLSFSRILLFFQSPSSIDFFRKEILSAFGARKIEKMQDIKELTRTSLLLSTDAFLAAFKNSQVFIKV